MRRGRVEDNLAGYGSGGGILAGDVKLVRSWVRNNHAPEGNYNEFIGGGVAARGDVSLLDTIVEDNSSCSGGGIWANGAVRAVGTVVRNNEAIAFSYDSSGGGISAREVRVVGMRNQWKQGAWGIRLWTTGRGVSPPTNSQP